MRIRVGDPQAAIDLTEFLRTRVGAIVEQTCSRPGGPSELEVSLLGSYGEGALRDEIVSSVRRWSMREGRESASIEIE
jgi:hypothetical protein